MNHDDMPDEYDPNEIEILARDELVTIVDGLLRANRPDRYEAGGEWLDNVAELVENKITIIEAKRMAARQIVGQREGRATRYVNRFLKSLSGDSGFVLPAAWTQYADEPVSLLDDEGKRGLRVAFRAMRAQDWQQFALHGRVEAQHRFDAEMAMYDAADWLAEQQEGRTFYEWASRVAPIAHPEAS
jgi:hypothetical protein